MKKNEKVIRVKDLRKTAIESIESIIATYGSTLNDTDSDGYKRSTHEAIRQLKEAIAIINSN